MKKSLLAAAVLAALMTVPASAGTFGTVVTPTVVPPPPPPPPGGLSHWAYVVPGVLIVCAIACGSSNSGTTGSTPGS
jgi:hypothetical protein